VLGKIKNVHRILQREASSPNEIKERRRGHASARSSGGDSWRARAKNKKTHQHQRGMEENSVWPAEWEEQPGKAKYYGRSRRVIRAKEG